MGSSRRKGGDHHELLPQHDDVLAVEDPSSDTTPASRGLHRRHFDSPLVDIHESHEHEEDIVVDTHHPFSLTKAKLSDVQDVEARKDKTSSDGSNGTEESFLNEHSIDTECTGLEEEESFAKSIVDRAGWLVGLLILQSCSSFILSNNQGLLESHIVLVQFLTMLVGAGGNAGNQASVRGTNLVLSCVIFILSVFV